MGLNGKEHAKNVNGYQLKPYSSRILPNDLQNHRKEAAPSCKFCHHVCQGNNEPKDENLIKTPKPLALERRPYDGT